MNQETVDTQEYEEFAELKQTLIDQIEFESDQQLEIWEREFAKLENVGKAHLFGIPYSQREISYELIRREFIDDIVPSWNDTH